MTWATPTPTSPSDGVPATKFGIAIGSGATLPSGITSLVWASASDGSSRAAPAPPIRTSRRESGKGGSKNDVTDIVGSFLKSSTVEHLLGIKIDVHVLPLVVALIPQHRVGLTLQHGPYRGFRRRLIAGRASGRHHLRRCREAAIRVQPDPDRDE